MFHILVSQRNRWSPVPPLKSSRPEVTAAYVRTGSPPEGTKQGALWYRLWAGGGWGAAGSTAALFLCQAVSQQCLEERAKLSMVRAKVTQSVRD